MRKCILSAALIFFLHIGFAQSLQPGFNGKESLDMLSLAFQNFDSAVINPKIPVPSNYTNTYRSPELGLKNRWNMWYRNDNKLAVICIRGTVSHLSSWLENYYAAMVPATGSLQLNDSTTFNYQLSADNKADVHVGWVVGLGHMAPTMVEQIKIAYSKGIREMIVAGHSQGGALALLTRSYLFYLAQKGEIPSDIIFKTYGSAAPKTGNLYYAYDFDFITRNGWGFTVLNAADWVPETLFSVQTITDFNPLNPFVHVKDGLKSQPLFVRWYINWKYNKMKNKTRKAQHQFEKTLGHLVYKYVRKVLPQLREPAYVHDNNYQRAGVPIILQPDAAYYTQFPNHTKNVFQHHLFASYYLLAKQYYSGN